MSQVQHIRLDVTCIECGRVWRVHMDDPRKQVACPACCCDQVVTVETTVRVEEAH